MLGLSSTSIFPLNGIAEKLSPGLSEDIRDCKELFKLALDKTSRGESYVLRELLNPSWGRHDWGAMVSKPIRDRWHSLPLSFRLGVYIGANSWCDV